MTRTDDLEARLGRALAFEPPALAGDRMDGRVRAAVVAAGRGPASRARRWPLGRRLAFGAGLAAAAVVLIAATTTLLGLYQSLPGDAYRIAWDRGQILGLSQTRDGYRVTLERAYADAGTVMLAVSVVDAQGRDHSQVGAEQVTVRGPAGELPAAFGMGVPLDRTTAANIWWFSPASALEAGTMPVVVTVPSIGVRDDATPPPSESPDWNPWHEVAGPWSFKFDLAVNGGVGLAPVTDAVSASGVTLALDSIVISPTVVRAGLSLTGASGDAWALVGTVAHEGSILGDGGGVVAAGSLQLTTGTGVEDASGDWVVTVTELVGMDERIAGRWTFRFSVP